MSTPPISTHSSPALQLKSSELSIVQEETEDEKSIDSDGEDKKGTNKNKEKLGRKESHPIDGGSDDGRGKEEGVRGGQGENESGTEEITSSPKLQETTPPAMDNDCENNNIIAKHVYMYSCHP